MSSVSMPEGLRLHPMKKIEVIVRGEDLPFLRELMEEAGVSGYTLIRDIAGMGQGGFHEGRLLFNEQASLVMAMAVAPEKAIRKIMIGLQVLFEQRTGVMFLSDTEVVRLDHFAREKSENTGS